MGRRPQPELRQHLLEACTDVALERGLPDRLEEFAVATGTSARMLVYHFGTRRGLQQAVLVQARERQLRAFGELLGPRADAPYPDVLAYAWAAISGPTGAPYVRLFGQWRGVAEPWPDFRRAATTDWLGPLQDGLGSPERATLALAVIRGLLMDLDATGETERVDAAFAQFVAGLSGATP